MAKKYLITFTEDVSQDDVQTLLSNAGYVGAQLEAYENTTSDMVESGDADATLGTLENPTFPPVPETANTDQQAEIKADSEAA